MTMITRHCLPYVFSMLWDITQVILVFLLNKFIRQRNIYFNWIIVFDWNLMMLNFVFLEFTKFCFNWSILKCSFFNFIFRAFSIWIISVGKSLTISIGIFKFKYWFFVYVWIVSIAKYIILYFLKNFLTYFYINWNWLFIKPEI